MSISENVTWGMRQGFAQGKIALPYSHFLGYRKGEDGPEVVEDEATVVRSIYRRYLEGNSPGQIVKALEEVGIPSPTGRSRWPADWCVGIAEPFSVLKYGTALIRTRR